MKEFKPTSWSVDNKTTIYVLTILVTLFGISSYNSLQKENFPDIVIPTFYVATPYPGTSPTDMENLVTRPLEKELKSVTGVKKIISNSVQDFSSLQIEFNANVDVPVAKQRVKDAVDKVRSDLPEDLPQEPDVIEINFSEFPIMNVNLSGPYTLAKLKKFADELQDDIEGYKEITRVDIIGAREREVQIDLDLMKMISAKVSFSDIFRAVQQENLTISGGNIKVGDMERALRVEGEFDDPKLIGEIIIQSVSGAKLKIKDLITKPIELVDEDPKSFARLDGNNVITLNVIKRAGENLIEASDKIVKLIEDYEKEKLPKNLKVTITGDQSTTTRNTVNDLVNTIIIGFLLVTLVLMFFMGTVNALFVGLSVPISSFLAFIVLPSLGFTLNTIVLFSFLLALGIVVDDAIVVIENTHRIFHQNKKNVIASAKEAAGEIFLPVLAGTLTTIAPFIPLAFWPGIVGKFMYFLPITLIIVLVASLLVAFIINPVFAVTFMKKESTDLDVLKKKRRNFWIWVVCIASFGVLFDLGGNLLIGNILITLSLLIIINKYVFNPLIKGFQEKLLPRLMNSYEKLLSRIIRKRNPYYTLVGIILILIFSFVAVILSAPKVDFFPSGEPNFVYTYIELPVGTRIEVTDSVASEVEKRVEKVVGKDNPDVESIITNVAIGAGDQNDFSTQATTHKAKVTVAFKEFAKRKQSETAFFLDSVRKAVAGIPGTVITVDKEQNGPPTGKPINIEISGDDFFVLGKLSKQVKSYIDSLQIDGIEDLKSDLIDKKPEINIIIDREKANQLGINTASVGSDIRTAVFGFEASKYKLDEDEYKIYVRLGRDYRESPDALLNMPITYRDMNGGGVKQIPLSAIAKFEYSNTYGGIKRINVKRVVTLSSNVLSDYTPNEVVRKIEKSLKGYPIPEGYEIKMTGEQEDQAETSAFLGTAGLLAIGLIFLILVTQFNSVSKPLIILSEIIFSVAGVLLGFALTGFNISIVFTGVGIVALAGIVVKNGILIVEFTDVLRKEGMELREAIIQAGKTRLNPVLLTAASTTLGLIPLALGMNINFFTLFTEFDAQIYFGGESALFWGPLAWTIIFGLTFATFLTLLVVPAMYQISESIKLKLKKNN